MPKYEVTVDATLYEGRRSLSSHTEVYEVEAKDPMWARQKALVQHKQDYPNKKNQQWSSTCTSTVCLDDLATGPNVVDLLLTKVDAGERLTKTEQARLASEVRELRKRAA